MNKHLPNSLRALFLSLAVLLSLPMLAEKVEIDGINYDLDAKAKQATVIAKSSGKYSGKVVIPESVKFKGVTHSVTSIGQSAFSGCSVLTSVTIGNSVTWIGEDAFYGCSGLTSVHIPNSVTSIGYRAFCDCSGLTSVHISDIAAWCNIDFLSTDSNPLYYAHHLYLNGEEVKDLVIPNSVTSIGERAFYECSGLTSVTIHNSVTSIGYSAFAFCSGLTSVHISDIAAWCNIDFGDNPLEYAHHLYLNGEEIKDLVIPNSVKRIGDDAFWCCDGLTSVTIPNSVTSIGAWSFSRCSGLTSVTIGNSVVSIRNGAFSNCSELLDVYCYAEKAPSTGSNVFNGSYPEYATLHVPDASIDSYQAREPWGSFGKIVALTPEETGIDELKGENGKVKTALYDLSGRRVQKGQKGIFIQNGKVMVK